MPLHCYPPRLSCLAGALFVLAGPGNHARAETPPGLDLNPFRAKSVLPVRTSEEEETEAITGQPPANTGSLGEMPSETEIIPELRSITLEEARDDGPDTIFSTTDDASEAGLLHQMLRERLDPFVGKPLKINSLPAIRAAAAAAFADAGEGLIGTVIPEQDITEGHLRVAFARAHLGTLTLSGNRYFDDSIYTGSLRFYRDGQLNTETLRHDLDWIARNPFRSVGAIYHPGDEFGEIDVELVTRETPPWSLVTGYDREGTELLGADRWFLGTTFGNVFGLDHRFSYQYFTDIDFDSLHGHFASYLVPLPWRHEFRVTGYYAESEALLDFSDLLGEPAFFELGGTSWLAAADYVIPLKPIAGTVRSDLSFGFDFKSSDSDLLFGSLSASDTNTEIAQFRGAWQGRAADSAGITTFFLEGIWSPGDISGGNNDEAFDSSRSGAGAGYLYARAGIDRAWKMPWGFQLLTDITGQISTSNLLASEQLVLSGDGAVRGFERSLLRGDRGFVSHVQLNAPAVALPVESTQWKVSPFGFWDYAIGSSIDRLPREPDSIHLGSTGLGILVNLNRTLGATCAYGWQVTERGFEDGESGRWHIAVTAKWR